MLSLLRKLVFTCGENLRKHLTVNPRSRHHRELEKVSTMRRCPLYRGLTFPSKEMTFESLMPPLNSSAKRMREEINGNVLSLLD